MSPNPIKLKKLGTKKEINTDIFTNEEYTWISAVLFSKVHPGFLLDHANEVEEIHWSGMQNDFVLVHNPIAKNPLEEELFKPATTIKKINGQIITEGKDIFPTIRTDQITYD